MRPTYAAPRAQLGPTVLAIALAVVGLLALPAAGPAAAREKPAMASAGWHGRAIQDPKPRPRLPRASWPEGWSAGPIAIGTGFARPGGSERVRDVQRRLTQLGYRPGPVDGLFGPRTRAAVRWFQYKHGLATRGGVNRSTVGVLHARSDHEPLRTAERRPAREPDTANTRPTPEPTVEPDAANATPAPEPAREPDAANATPAPEPAREPDAANATPAPTAARTQDDGGTDYAPIVVALLLALCLGVLTGLLGPELRRALRRVPDDEPPATPDVLGYTTARNASAAAEAIARRCAEPGWSLVEVLHEGGRRDVRLAERRALVHAMRELRDGRAQGLVVAGLRDVGPRVADLATVLHWLAEADAFLAVADHELDTSTEEGRDTARAIAELGAWERRSAGGRFTPDAAHLPTDLAEQLAAMLQRGISPRAVTDALALAGLAGGEERTTTEERRRM